MQNRGANEFPVPESFLVPPFYLKNSKLEKFVHLESVSEIIKIEPFYFDILYHLDIELEETPWDLPERFVPIIFEQWKELKPLILHSFSLKKINSRANIQSLSLFLICLFWTNETSVKGLKIPKMNITNLKYKPVNCEERISFVIERPNQYHSFVQIQQLFDELEKLYYKSQALKNNNGKGITHNK